MHVVIFENFVKSMPPSLSELKVKPSFCFPFKISDDPTETNYRWCKSFPPSYFFSFQFYLEDNIVKVTSLRTSWPLSGGKGDVLNWTDIDSLHGDPSTLEGRLWRFLLNSVIFIHYGLSMDHMEKSFYGDNSSVSIKFKFEGSF